MVFVSFEVEKMRMFLVQSVVRWCWVLVRSWGAVYSLLSRVKDRFQLAPVSWPSCRQQLNLPVHAPEWKSCLPYCVTNSSFIPNSTPLMPYFSRYNRPSNLIPAPLALTEIYGPCALFCSHFAKSPGQSPSQSPGQSPSQVSKSVSKSVSESPSQSFSFVQLVFWLNLIHIQQVGLTISFTFLVPD